MPWTDLLVASEVAPDDLASSSATGKVLKVNGSGALEWGDDTGGSITALTGNVENRIPTFGNTTTELVGESGLTYNGSTLDVTGTISASSSFQIDGNTLIATGENYLKLNQANLSAGVLVYNGGLTVQHQTADAKIEIKPHADYDAKLLFNDGDANKWEIMRDESDGHLHIGRAPATSYPDIVINKDNGFIGIGTDNPGAMLDVYDTGGNASIRLYRSSDRNVVIGADDFTVNQTGGIDYTFKVASNDGMKFKTSNEDAMIITKAQNVGIGTTSLNAKLRIVNTANQSTLNVESSDDSDAMINIVHTGTDLSPAYSGMISLLHTNTTGSDDFIINDQTSNFVLKGDGKVGIGIANPVSTLHVEGTSSATSGSGAGESGILLKADGDGVLQGWKDGGVNIGHGTYSTSHKVMIHGATSIVNGDLSIGSDKYVKFGNGTSSIRGTGDAGMLRFYTGSTERMRIANDGKVGIANTGPDSHLHIRGTTPQIRLQNDGQSDYLAMYHIAGTARIFTEGSAKLHLGAAGNGDRLRIATDGSVGIGVDPQAKLDVSGLLIEGGADGWNDANATTGNDGDWAEILSTGGTGSAPFNNAGSLLLRARAYANNERGSINFYTGKPTAHRMRITHDGNVGIGTDSPSSNLHLYSDSASQELRIETDANGGTATIKLDGSSNASYRSGAMFFTCRGAGESRIEAIRDGADDTSNLSFGTSNSGSYDEAIRIDSTGKVGIGTDSPSDYYMGNLVVSSGGVNAGINIATTNKDSGEANISFGADNELAYGRIEYKHRDVYDTSTMAFLVEQSEKLKINANGNIDVAGTVVTRSILAKNSSGLGLYDDSGQRGIEVVDGGNVGIRTDTADKTLTIAQSADDSGIRISGYDDMSGRTAGIYLDSYGQLYIKNAENRSDGLGNQIIYLDAGHSIWSNQKHLFEAGLDATSSASDLSIGGSYDADIIFKSGTNSNIMKIDAGTHNVGIGIANPSAQLAFKGNLSKTLTGTVAVTNSSKAVTGSGTAFLTEVPSGSTIKINTEIFTVSTVASDTALQLDSNYLGSTASIQTAYTDYDFLAITTNDGSEKVRIDNAGFVGIGTDSPSAKLHVLAGNDNDAIRVTGTDANYYGSLHYTNASNTTFNILNSYTSADGAEIKFGFGSISSNTNVMTLLKSGKVGIGTTTPDNTLTVQGYLSVHESGNAHSIRINHDSIYGYNTALYMNYASAQNIAMLDGASTGKVGIGTDTPDELFHVEGSGATYGRIESTGSYAGIRIKSQSHEWGWNVDGGSDTFYIYNDSTQHMLINNSGNVGIGTDSPLTRFHAKYGNSTLASNATGNTIARFENDGSVDIQFASLAGTYQQGFNFGDQNDADIGQFHYIHDSDKFRFIAGTNEILNVKSTGLEVDGIYGNNAVEIDATAGAMNSINIDATNSIGSVVRGIHYTAEKGGSGGDNVGMKNVLSMIGNDAKSAYGVQTSIKLGHSNLTGYGYYVSDDDASTAGTVYGFYADLDDANLTKYPAILMGGTVGIGTASPDTASSMEVAGSSTKDGRIFINTYDTSTRTSQLSIGKSNNNTVGTKTETTSGTVLGMIRFVGVGHTTGAWGYGAYIEAVQTANLDQGNANGNIPTKLDFWTFGSGDVGELKNKNLTLQYDSAIFNEGGADIDFRVESDNNANMLFVDAGNDRVGIGTDSPSDTFTVNLASASDSVHFSHQGMTAFEIVRSGDDDTIIKQTRANTSRIFMHTNAGTASSNASFVVAGQSGGGDRIGIGTDSPAERFHVKGADNEGIVALFEDGTEKMYMYTGSGIAEFGTQSDTSLSFATNQTAKMTLTSAGVLNIGGQGTSTGGLSTSGANALLGRVELSEINFVGGSPLLREIQLKQNSSDLEVHQRTFGGASGIVSKWVTGNTYPLSYQVFGLADTNVSIGNDGVPTEKLHVQGNIKTTGNIVTSGNHTLDASGVINLDADDGKVYLKDDNVVYGVLTKTGSANLRIQSGSGEATAIDFSGANVDFKGNVTTDGTIGLNGLTNSNYDAGADDLVLGSTSGNGGLTIVSGTSNVGYINFADGTTGSEQYRAYFYHNRDNDEFAMVNFSSGSGKYFKLHGNGTIEAPSNVTVDGTIYCDSVGIGTTSPDELLHIKGGHFRMESSGAGVVTNIQSEGPWGSSGGGDGGLQFQVLDSTGNARIQHGMRRVSTASNGDTVGDYPYEWWASNADGGLNFRMKLNRTGLGIGTQNPAQKLDISSGNIQLSDAYGIFWGVPTERLGIKGSEDLDKIYFEIDNTDTYAFEWNKFTTNSSVSVGIGTTSPVTELDVIGSKSQSNGSFAIGDASHRDAQTIEHVARNQTTNATETELFLNGSSTRMTIPTDTAWMFNIQLVARRTSGQNENAAYQIKGLIENTGGTVTQLESKTTIVHEDVAGWDAVTSADDTNDALIIEVTGEASKTINWVAFIRIVEVTG